MNKVSMLFISICALYLSCTSAEYYKTGKEFSPLKANEDVAVFTASKPDQSYSEIGLIRIRGGKLEKRIEEAREYARANGGNGLIAKEIGIITDPVTGREVERIGTSTYETQEFLIIRFDAGKLIAKNVKLEESGEDMKDQPGSIPELPGKASAEYSAVPRASYNQLLLNYAALRGKQFRGELYPRKIYRIPASMKPYMEAGDRLVLMASKSGKNRIYLIVNEDHIPGFKQRIKKGSMLDFIYTPERVLRSKDGRSPVIKFIEEVKKQKI